MVSPHKVVGFSSDELEIMLTLYLHCMRCVRTRLDKLAFLRHFFVKPIGMQKQKLQPIFLEDLTLSFSGFKIQRFAHHKHSDQSDQISAHKHAHSQFLLYLRGRGIQTTSTRKQPVMRGSFLYFPPQTIHGFIKSMESPPLSLVFDFKEKKPLGSKPIFKSLAPPVLSEIERTLHRMIQSADLSHEKSPRMAAQILTLFAVLHDNLGQGMNQVQGFTRSRAKFAVY